MVLCVSLSAATCDLSCAFSQRPVDCGSLGATTRTTRLDEPMPMQMTGMDHKHCAHGSKLGRIELPTVHGEASMGACQHQPCIQPSTLALQKITPPNPRFAHAVLTEVTRLRPGDAFVVARHSDSASFPLNPSALDPLSTSLRI